jgi:ribosomal-protein-alanine N-acetyltransferase
VLKIRCVQPQDIIPVNTLAYETLPERYNPGIFNQFYEAFPEGFLVAELHNTIIGFLIGVKTTKTTARILMLTIEKNKRKHGVGSSLLSSFLQVMKHHQVTCVELEVRTTNQSAIEFYKKHGFSIRDTLQRFYQNREDAYNMSKSLL